MSPQHSLCIDINGFQYDYDKELSGFSFDDDRVDISVNDDGIDFGASVGWRVRHDNGVGVRGGVDYLRMGSDVDVGSIGAGVSYSF